VPIPKLKLAWMNKAFTKEDDEAPSVIPPRAPLPSGTTNYVTPRGLRLLHEERERLQSLQRSASDPTAHADQRRLQATLAARMHQLDERIASAVVVAPSAQAQDTVRFGASVVVRNEEGRERRLQIVGVDEADAAHGLIAFFSPVARALLGRQTGDVVQVSTPRGTEELEVLEVSYVSHPSP
jgi:transcription elongation factor GreB